MGREGRGREGEGKGGEEQEGREGEGEGRLTLMRSWNRGRRLAKAGPGKRILK